MRCVVKVIAAQDLPEAGDTSRYIRVLIKTRHHHEDTTPAQGPSPEFNQEFTLTYPSRDEGLLRVVLYESVETDIDKKIGSAVVKLSEIPDNEEHDATYDLSTKDGANVGKVHLAITVSETDTVSEDVDDDNIDDVLGQLDEEIKVDMPEALNLPTKTEPEPVEEAAPEPEPEPVAQEEAPVPPKEEEAVPEPVVEEEEERGPCRVVVRVVEARNVTSDGNEGFLDPYCTVQITGHRRRAKTQVLEGSTALVWNEEFAFHVKKTRGESITVMLKDKNDKEELGRLVLPLKEVGEAKDDWWNFEPLIGKSRGSVHLNVRVEKTDEGSDDDPWQYDPVSEAPKDEDDKDGARMLVRAEIVEARGLARMDVLSRSDPFCKVRVTTNPHFYKTKVIKNSLSPEWNDTFTWHVADYRQATLEIEMFDWNEIQKNAEMARLSIPLTKAKNGKVDEWFEMNPVEGVQKGGEIHVVISMEPTEELSDDDVPEDTSDHLEVKEEEQVAPKEEKEPAPQEFNDDDEEVMVGDSTLRPRNRKERLRATALAYNQDPDQVEEMARKLALRRYREAKAQLKQEFEQRPNLKNHPERILFNNEENLEKEKQARYDPTQMSGMRLARETKNLEQELEEVNAEIEQLNRELAELEARA